MDLIEDLSIYEELKERLHANKKLLDGNDVLKKHGLSLSNTPENESPLFI